MEELFFYSIIHENKFCRTTFSIPNGKSIQNYILKHYIVKHFNKNVHTTYYAVQRKETEPESKHKKLLIALI